MLSLSSNVSISLLRYRACGMCTHLDLLATTPLYRLMLRNVQHGCHRGSAGSEWQMIPFHAYGQSSSGQSQHFPSTLADALLSDRIKTAARSPGQLFRIARLLQQRHLQRALHRDSVMIGSCLPVSSSHPPNPPTFPRPSSLQCCPCTARCRKCQPTTSPTVRTRELEPKK